MASIIELCKVQPSSVSEHQLSLPLTHFDIPFLLSDPTQRVLFFQFPFSKTRFLETIVPSLKRSLSLTLNHFPPLAGNIILSLNSGDPVSRYVAGDSVSLTVAECDNDFNYLTGNNQRISDEFYVCVPPLPPTTRSFDYIVIPVFALQITLFPEQGICLGLTNYHAIADECSIVNFLEIWATLNRNEEIETSFLPAFDRATVRDPRGLESKAWNSVQNKFRVFPVESPSLIFPLNRVRSTFIITKNDVQTLKNYVLEKIPNVCHLSSFSVICAHVWTCSERASVSTGEKVDEDEPVYFSFAAECRERLNPPLPSRYFGNCVVFVIAESKHGLLKKNEGFLVAAESIGEAIKRTVFSQKGILEAADWPVDFQKYSGKRIISVAGSPRFDVYDVDYGWGKTMKYEFIHLDREKSISLCKSEEINGGFEIGLSREKSEMDAFEAFFKQGLQIT